MVVVVVVNFDLALNLLQDLVQALPPVVVSHRLAVGLLQEPVPVLLAGVMPTHIGEGHLLCSAH